MWIKEKIYLDVPFKDKDRAKALGARWDADVKSWYYINPEDKDKFSEWSIAPFMKLEDLSDEQRNLIEKARRGENVLVDACIGSGKTTAIQVLCNELSDKKILYLTYNRLLKLDAQKKIKAKNVVVTNYHGFASMVLRQAGISVGISDLIQAFNQHKPAFGRKFDMVVIDEYQDIEQEIAEMLLHIKDRNPGIQIIAVGDMMQKIYDKTTLDVPDFIDYYLERYSVLHFTKCFRLSKDIAARLGNIWEKEINGVNLSCTVERMNIYEVIEVLAAASPSEILCLGKREGAMSRVLNKLEENFPEKFNKGTVYASIREEDGNVAPTAESAIFTTFDSSKGLERRICVVFDFTEEYWETRIEKPMTKSTILRNIFCVAASRGKERIIFVNQPETTQLSDETLSRAVMTNENFTIPFLISEMFDFKYKEDVEACYRLLDIKKIADKTEEDIGISVADKLIDLSPCVGIYQEAAFFEGYKIDDQIQFMQDKHPDRPKLKIPEDADVDTKILYMTAFATCYDRYVTQVKLPFITEDQKNTLFDRLGKTFNGLELVQQDCSMTLEAGMATITIEGRADVIKGDVVYELKYISELSHEDFLQLAAYIVCLNIYRPISKGILYNVKTGEKYEVAVPDTGEFLNTVIRTVTKGAITC